MNISLFTALEAKKHLVYIDTGGSFCGARLKEMLTESKSCDDDQVCGHGSTLKVH